MMKFKFIWDEIRPTLRPEKRERLKRRYLEVWYQRSEPHYIQTRFIYEQVVEFFDLFEKRWIQKVLDDISHILNQKWAFSIWEADFYHGHICGRSKTPMMNLDALLSASNVCFLYHTFEQQAWTPQAANRNILSFPDGHPEVVHPDYEFGKFPGYGVSSEELGLMEYARFDFKESFEGPFTLKDGTKINLWGLFP
jgi:hypothetical protein